MITLNKHNKPVNVLHFQGKNIHILPKTVNLVYNTILQDKHHETNKFDIITIFTHYDNAILAKQLDRYNIKYINAIPNDYDYSQNWYMPNKIKFIIDALENKTTKDIVMILDGYDVLFVSFDGIIDKFKSQHYQILYNSTYNNFPEEDIDYIQNRLDYDDFMPYFNAGCCIGYKDALIKFYKECLKYINIENELNSEQKIIRNAFANYSNKQQNFIWIDFERNIFQTMGMTKVNYSASNNILKITDNKNFKL